MFFFQQKNGASNIVATAQMKFASEARPSQYIGPFGNTEPTCMPLSGHFMFILLYYVYVFVAFQRASRKIGSPIELPSLNKDFTYLLTYLLMDIEGRVLVYQTERYQLSPTYNASW